MIRNIHQRRLAASPDQVWELLTTLSSPDDRLWPDGWPPVRLDGPLAVGARGGHGPVHYDVTAMDKDVGLVLTFREPTGLVGHHAFQVIPDGSDGTLLRHELVGRPQGRMRVLWPLAMRWLHDTVVEELLDRAERGTGTVPAQPYQRSWWVRTLRAVPSPRRALPVPSA